MKLIYFLFGFLLLGCNSKENKTSAPNPSNPGVIENSNNEIQNQLKNGDLIFHTSLSNQSMAIQIATDSKYSHMGILYKDGDQFKVYEAVQPIKFTPLQDWINRGKDKKYVVKRLKKRDEVITEESLQKMKTVGQKYIGKDYDLKFEWSDNRIYCSELVCSSHSLSI